MNLTEKYRPKTLEEVVGQDEIINILIQKEELNHMLFSGPPGSGKTTVAYILADKFNLNLKEFNASDERGIDVIRGEIKRLSRIKGKRIILLDECDNLTQEAQAALRRTMERTDNAYFILTGNDSWKIIEPIKSRCANYNFKRIDDVVILRRILEICNAEGIEIDEEAQEGLVELIKQAAGDMRKAINILSQIVDKNKKITARAVLSLQKPKLASDALAIALGGDFEKAQRLVENAFISSRMESKEIIKEFYDAIGRIQEVDIRVRLYNKLAEVERACKIESDPILPLVQLVSFVAYGWLLPHLAGCPLMDDEKK